MATSIVLTKEQAHTIRTHERMITSTKEAKEIKYQLLDAIETFYGDLYDRFKPETRQLFDFICWISADRGYFYCSQQYLNERLGVSERTIRSRMRELAEAGIIQITYTRNRKGNSRGKPIYFFMQHPCFPKWSELLHFQNDCQDEKELVPTDCKTEKGKRSSTFSLTYVKEQEIKKPVISLNEELPSSFLPHFIPDRFKQLAGCFFTNDDVINLWSKAMYVYGQEAKDYVRFEDFINVTTQAIRETVTAYKRKTIRKRIGDFYFGTLKRLVEEANHYLNPFRAGAWLVE